RRGECAALRRRVVRSRDAALTRALHRPRHPRRDLCAARIPHGLAFGHVEPPARPGCRRRLDRAGARALAAAQYRARAGTRRARLPAPGGGSRGRAEAGELPDRLGDVGLRPYALAARAAGAVERLDFAEAASVARRRFDVLPGISDPDHILSVYEAAVPSLAGVNDLSEARSVAAAHVALSRTLTPHHRIHGIGLTLEIGELAGHWEALRAASCEVEEAVDANRATPGRRNPRLLLLGAAASAGAGEEDEGARLERAAAACGMEDSGSVLAGARLRLALLRGDPAAAEPLLDPSPRFGFFAGPAAIVARLDAAAALPDRARVELEAPPLLQPGTYAEPFALRAVGIVRNDETLVDEAHARFAALGLDWYEAQTPSLMRTAKRS